MIHKPKQVIKITRDTSPCIDIVQYQLLKYLPGDSYLLLLYILNHIWLMQDFPTSWKTAIIISVPKLGKVLTDPGSGNLWKELVRWQSLLWALGLVPSIHPAISNANHR